MNLVRKPVQRLCAQCRCVGDLCVAIPSMPPLVLRGFEKTPVLQPGEAHVAIMTLDARDFSVAARMLDLLNVGTVRLLTNNPTKIAGLEQAGIEVTGRMSIEAPVTSDNRRYLQAKAARAGHLALARWLEAKGKHEKAREPARARAHAGEPRA